MAVSNAESEKQESPVTATLKYLERVLKHAKGLGTDESIYMT